MPTRMRNQQRSLASISLALLLAFPVVAWAQTCPANQYPVCFNHNCACIARLSGDTATLAAEAIKALEAARAPVLEAWLQASRNDSWPLSASVPPQIRAALAGYVSEDVLNLARFMVTDNSSDTLNLGTLAIAYGDLVNGRNVIAITLIDVIIFNNEDDAQDNPALWAHELTHVKQFMDWGVRDFARYYVNDAASVEAAASMVEDGYAGWKAAKGSD